MDPQVTQILTKYLTDGYIEDVEETYKYNADGDLVQKTVKVKRSALTINEITKIDELMGDKHIKQRLDVIL